MIREWTPHINHIDGFDSEPVHKRSGFEIVKAVPDKLSFLVDRARSCIQLMSINNNLFVVRIIRECIYSYTST